MKKFFKFAAVAAIAAAFVSCGNEKPGPEPGPDTPSSEYTQDLKFTLELKEVDTDQAKVVVEHNGTTKDSWYGFATTETDIDKAIADALLQENVKLQEKTRYTMTVKNLEPETDYTFVAVGVTADGKTYGEVATLEFTTEAEEVGTSFTENPNWTLAYTGAKEYKEQTYKHTVTVTSTDENKWFLSTAWTAADFEEAMTEYGIETILQYELKELKEYADYLTDYSGQEIAVTDLLYKGTDWDVVTVTPGDWYVMAVGVNDNGELSGLYAISDVITIEEEQATEEYNAWLGTWTFTGANGMAMTATFEKNFNNESYNMYGFDAADLGYDYPVEVTWLADYDLWAIYPQEGGEVYFDDGTSGDLLFLGAQQTAEGYSLITDAAICIGGFDENGNRVVMGNADEESGLNITLMSHFVVMKNIPYFWEDPTLLPTFPMTITAAEAAPAAKAKANGTMNSKKRVCKLAKPIVPGKTFTSYMPLQML